MNQNEWNKLNMKSISFRYKTDFVEEFRSACDQLGIRQSQYIREAMQKVIDEAREKKSDID